MMFHSLTKQTSFVISALLRHCGDCTSTWFFPRILPTKQQDTKSRVFLGRFRDQLIVVCVSNRCGTIWDPRESRLLLDHACSSGDEKLEWVEGGRSG